MSQAKNNGRRDRDTMRAEYDFSKATRGQTHRRYAQGTSIVVLEPDVAKFFPDSAAVNDALRVLSRLGRTPTKPGRRRNERPG